MNEIRNHIKNAVDNRITEYVNMSDFAIKSITNSKQKYKIKYAIKYQDTSFSIGIEYINNDIELTFISGLILNIDTLYKITDLVEFIESMPKEHLISNFKKFLG
ncbi:hypothetical protein SGQ83_22670 [Flavobacterium sp. Fl-318]|uniref:Uncharacterized protein n=1 Tax=Flavobacterium cupriresistens TaxID=2893885 RepID=A0ABU4RHW8_9FLAO|nr:MULTISPECIES: hypothetical protein [unclassified Flavobacterium]MDX6192157.1 hypothetical protein [Flavobacterium sp. Fl-318]UFH44613.1 hypothetical protein LNP23_10505 [Flavobacterium sp. F-323]